jgi:hypothetical protein
MGSIPEDTPRIFFMLHVPEEHEAFRNASLFKNPSPPFHSF